MTKAMNIALAALVSIGTMGCTNNSLPIVQVSPPKKILPVKIQRCNLWRTHDEDIYNDEYRRIVSLRVVNSAEITSGRKVLEAPALSYEVRREVFFADSRRLKEVDILPFDYIPNTTFYLEGPSVCRRYSEDESGNYSQYVGLVYKYNVETEEIEWSRIPPKEKEEISPFPGFHWFGPQMD